MGTPARNPLAAARALMFGVGALLSLHCNGERRFACIDDGDCDQGLRCDSARGTCLSAESTCAVQGTCPSGERCAEIATTRRCVPAEGACVDHQDCPTGALCNGRLCTFAGAHRVAQRALSLDDRRESLDEVSTKAAATCVSVDASVDFELGWEGLDEDEHDLLTVYLFRRPPIAVDGTIVNLASAAVAWDTVESPDASDATTYANMQLNGGSRTADLPAGRYYWFVRGFRGGNLVSASDIAVLDVVEDPSGCPECTAADAALASLCFEGNDGEGACVLACSAEHASAALVCSQGLCEHACASKDDCAEDVTGVAPTRCDFDRGLGPPGSGICEADASAGRSPSRSVR